MHANTGYSAITADRAARRAYRRSLPPLYRWRRVLIGLVVAALVIGAAVFLRGDPVETAKQGWYLLTKGYVPVSGLEASVEPPDQVVGGTDALALVDGTDKELTLNWTPSAILSCGPAVGSAEIVLTFPQTRVRRVVVMAGLAKTNPARAQQPLPAKLSVRIGDACDTLTLKQSDDWQDLPYDSKQAVTSLRIGIQSAFPSAQGAAISLTEIRLKSFPTE